jgi:hypothetical protein
MTLGYQLFIALLLLLPGIVGWVCVRAGSTDDLLSPMPDRQGSTTTLAAIVLFACLGHLLAAMAIDLNVCAPDNDLADIMRTSAN